MSTQLTLRHVADQAKEYWTSCSQTLQSGASLDGSKAAIQDTSGRMILDAQQAISAELQNPPVADIAGVFRERVTDVCNHLSSIEGLFESSPFPREILFQPFIERLTADVNALCLKRNFTPADAAEFQRLSNQLTVIHPLRERFWSVEGYTAVRNQLMSVHPYLQVVSAPSTLDSLMPLALGVAKAALNVIDRVPLPLKAGALLYGYYLGCTRLSAFGTIVVGCQLLSKSSVFATPKPISLPPTFDAPAAAASSGPSQPISGLPPMISASSARAPALPQPRATGTLVPNDFLKDGRSRKAASVVVQAASFLGEFFASAVVNVGLINTAQRNGALTYYTALGTSQPLEAKVRGCSFISLADLMRQPTHDLFSKVALANSYPKPAILNTYTEALQDMRTDATAQGKPVGMLLTKGEGSLAITYRINEQRNVEIGVFDPATSSFYQFDTIDAAAIQIDRLCSGMPSAQNQVGLAKAKKALPVDPVSLEPISEERQITVNGNTVDIVGFTVYLVKTWQKGREGVGYTFQDYNSVDISPNDMKNLLRQIATYYHISIRDLFCGLVEEPNGMNRLYAQINTLRTNAADVHDAARLDFLVRPNILDSLYAAAQRPAKFLAVVNASAGCPRDRKESLRADLLPPNRPNPAPAAPVDIPADLAAAADDDAWPLPRPARAPAFRPHVLWQVRGNEAPADNPYAAPPNPFHAIGRIIQAAQAANFHLAMNQGRQFDHDD